VACVRHAPRKIWRMRILAWLQTGCVKFASPDDAAEASPAGR
jgi:hypothetical protein